MSKPQKEQLGSWPIGDTKDYTFIETGCNKGHTVSKASMVFPVCHSIELNDKFFKFCRDRFREHPRITVHHGRSEKILPELVDQVTGPICFWLDAHGAPGAPCGGHVPLISELETAIGHGHDRDVIAIDDTRCFGRDARDQMGDNWLEITMDKVEGLLSDGGFGNIQHWPAKVGSCWHRSGVMVAKR